AVLFTVFIYSCKEDTAIENSPNITASNSPVLIYPENESTIQTLTPTLDWQDYSNALSYKVQVSTDANYVTNVLIDTPGISNSQLTVQQGKLTTNTSYYWRVKVFLSNDSTQWSDVWRFSVILSPPGAPNLISPHNNSTGQSFTPLLDWNDVVNAATYRAQISINSSFAPTLIDSSRISISQFQVPIMILNTNTQYFWRVNASNSNGVSTGPWSSVWNFTTIPGPEPNSIGGTITFADTNFLLKSGEYEAGAYLSWPPNAPPSGKDTLSIKLIGNLYQSIYKIKRLFNGNYYVAVKYRLNSKPREFIMGIYGCDTAHVKFSQCPLNPPAVSISNNFGVANINFLSWADTTKKIF
ncbi:MAG: hypothetical protein ACRDFC_04785, partial [Ignavibacteria bacterium]